MSFIKTRLRNVRNEGNGNAFFFYIRELKGTYILSCILSAFNANILFAKGVAKLNDI